MDSGEEVAGGFFIARCDASELFESIEETLDEIAFGVEGEVALAADLAVGLGRAGLMRRTIKAPMKPSAS